MYDCDSSDAIRRAAQALKMIRLIRFNGRAASRREIRPEVVPFAPLIVEAAQQSAYADLDELWDMAELQGNKDVTAIDPDDLCGQGDLWGEIRTYAVDMNWAAYARRLFSGRIPCARDEDEECRHFDTCVGVLAGLFHLGRVIHGDRVRFAVFMRQARGY